MTTNNNSDSNIEQFRAAEIGEGLFHLKLPLGESKFSKISTVNSYLVKGTDGWVMIDTGWYTALAWETLNKSLAEIRISPDDIRTIIVTHSHPDHFGMAGRIKHLSPNIQMLMHRWEADLIESRFIRFSEPQIHMSTFLRRHGAPENDVKTMSSASMPSLEFVSVTLPDHVLYGGETIETGIYNLEVIWTPGHSPGHICLYEAKNKILFSGDHVLTDISPNVSSHVLSGDDPLGDYINSLAKLRQLPVSKVYPGHQSSFDNIQERIDSTKAHHERRENEIQSIIGCSFFNAYQIAEKLSWSSRGQGWNKFPPLIKRFALTETIAHLEHMRWEGKITKVFRDDRFLYSCRG